jgi:hypothetical protein
MSVVTAMCSSPAIGCVVHIPRCDRMHAAHGSGRCMVDAGDRRRGVGNRSMHRRATTLTLHTCRAVMLHLLLKDITHLCT